MWTLLGPVESVLIREVSSIQGGYSVKSALIRALGNLNSGGGL